MSYTNYFPWTVISGNGYSIGLIEHSLDNSFPENWEVSDIKYGTPFHTGIVLPWKASVFPNPVKDFVTIHPGEPDLAFSKFRIDIFNQTGFQVRSLSAESNNSRMTINISN